MTRQSKNSVRRPVRVPTPTKPVYWPLPKMPFFRW